MQDAVDLVEEALQQTEVAAREPGDRGSSLDVREVVGIKLFSQLLPLLSEDELHLVARERWIGMGETDATVELRVTAHAFLDAGHADQDQPDLGSVELVAQVFQGAVGEAFRFIDSDQLSMLSARFSWLGGLRIEGLIDAGLDTVAESVEVLAQCGEGACDWRRIEDRARPRQGGIDLFIGGIAWSPAFQQRLREIPFGVSPGGKGFANSGGAIAQPNGTILADGARELDKAFMGAGFDEGGVGHLRRPSL